MHDEIGVDEVLRAFGVGRTSKRPCSFAFSSRVAPSSWKAYFFDLPSRLPFYLVVAPQGKISAVRSLASGIRAENFVLLADLAAQALLVLRRSKKGENTPLFVPLRRGEDFERVVNVVRKFNFGADELSAHAALSNIIDLLSEGAAERFFVNRGLFSNYFLRERLSSCLAERERSPSKESARFLSGFAGEFPPADDVAVEVLSALGYSLQQRDKPGYAEYGLRWHGVDLDVSCVVAPVDSLDVKTPDRVAPSYQAVAALRRTGWVILTNGRLWRLYSSRVSSSSTNYFEVDLEGVADEGDPKLIFFVALFSASSFVPRKGVTDIELVYEGGLRYAKEVEDDLRAKVFDGQLFLNLIRGIMDYAASKEFTQKALDDAKASALKLLYRLLFVLYAESRGLLPLENPEYQVLSLGSLRTRLDALEKQPDAASAWVGLQRLFRAVGDGDLEANVPEYDGALFEKDAGLDGVTMKNRFLVPVLRDLMEVDGRGIDYQNLGVQHLGSLYEGLLAYSVFQAKQDLVIYKDEILDAEFAADLKQKPRGFIAKGELYLSVGGLARKRTGSYYTPEPIVQFLVRKGLASQFKAREERFRVDLERFRASKTADSGLARKCTEDLLGLKVVDPAMGSGHFLVAAVDEITRWIIDLLEENPDAPLVLEIDEYRREIIEEQRKRGIRLDEDLLTDNVILKRLVMKRCVYGVDINPLAVELAKLSLWLDSFTIGTPLTFLDHHVRCGDSLIGLWLKDIGRRVFDATLDAWMGTIAAAGASLFKGVSLPADLTVEQVSKSRGIYDDVRAQTAPLRTLLDMACAGIIEPKTTKELPKNLPLIAETSKKEKKPKWWDKVEDVLKLSETYRFFHWELEFPDAFTDTSWGFDLVVMNPPWEAFRPEDDEFFSVYYPRFRRIRSKPEKKKVMKRLLKNPEIETDYEEYKKMIEQKVKFFKSKQYVRQGRGGTNLWKLFLERIMNIVSDDGSFGLVVPSGVVTDMGAKLLREALFEKHVKAIYEFENRKGIFDIHRSYKFVLLVADNSEPSESLSAAFYLHDIESLDGKTEQGKFVKIPTNLVRMSAPSSLSIPELRNEKQLEVFSWLYKNHPLLNDEKKGWTVALLRELDRTNDSDLFRSDQAGWPLIEGKHFHQFLPNYEKPIFTIAPRPGLERTRRHGEYQGINKEIHQTVRLAFREVASSTNVRSMIACILPPRCFSPHTVVIVLAKKDKTTLTGREYLQMTAYLAGLFNSMIFDFALRARSTMHASFFYVYQTPVPFSLNEKCVKEITRISARLSSTDERYREFASALGVELGPLSMKERLELTARLNALVAKQYGLSRKQLGVVLDSFDGFEEDEKLVNMKEVKWNDTLIRKFNGEVRKRVLTYFDKLNPERVSDDT
jgi:hypothetical protein